MKNILRHFITFVAGGLLVSLVLHSRIQTRYDNGYNNGFIDGGFEVIHFLEEHVQNENKEAEAPTTHFDFKYARISVVEIDGVTTIHVE